MKNSKGTPKSCSCAHCRLGKGSKAGNCTMKRNERAFRRKTKEALNKGEEDIPPAPHGDRTD